MKSENSKIRVLAVAMMLRTGERMTTSKILRNLSAKYGITADRKTIYDDIYAINRFVPIESTPGRGGGYQVVDVLGRCNDA